MTSNLTPLDICNQPNILRLAEEVQSTKTPRVLMNANESIAIVMPITTVLPQQVANIWQQYDAKRVQKALKESTGALEGVDKETLLRDIRA